jgi:hypothetical protein
MCRFYYDKQEVFIGAWLEGIANQDINFTIIPRSYSQPLLMLSERLSLFITILYH